MKKIMKKIIVIMLLIISNVTLADGGMNMNLNSTPVKNEYINIELLRPITPTETTFEDDTLDLVKLQPVTPKEATFEE